MKAERFVRSWFATVVWAAVLAVPGAGDARAQTAADPVAPAADPAAGERQPVILGGCQILLPPPGEDGERATFQGTLWTNGVVPYDFETAAGPAQVNATQQLQARLAMDAIEAVCDVVFVPRTFQTNFIHIQNSTGNSSFVGMIGGSQAVNIFNWNVRFIIVHELVHALGFWHEHQRPDRNTFIQLFPNNVQGGPTGTIFTVNFPIRAGSQTVGVYDFQSVMHYDECAFAVACLPWGGCPCAPAARTIEPLPAFQVTGWEQLMGQRAFLSPGDIAGLCFYYGCAPPNNNCAGAVAVFDGTNIVDNRGATNSPLGGCGAAADTWYFYDATCSGQLSVNMSNISAGYSPTLAAFDGGSCPPGAQLACDGSGAATISIPVVLGNRYLLRVGGNGASMGTGNLNINCAPLTCTTGFNWTQVGSTPTPGQLIDPQMAYDNDRDRIVLFGGRDSNLAPVGSTWEWESATATWVLRSTTGPVARAGHAMAYDRVRQRVVMFGGRDANATYLGDTWEWDGAAGAWNLRSNSGPVPRHQHNMAYDISRNRTVLFGGFGNTPALGDTWEWNGSSWSLRSSSGPSPRYEFGMAYDSGRGVTVLFSGNGVLTADTWEWNGAAWTQRATTGPSHRVSHELVYDAAAGSTVLFGGYQGGPGPLRDTWVWNGTAWTQVSMTGPSARFGHAMAFDESDGATYVFGGGGAGFFQDTWRGSLGFINDDWANAVAVGNGSTPVDTRCANDGGTGCARLSDVWYLYTATCSGNATVSVTGATFAANVAIYSGTVPIEPALECAAASPPVATFPVSAGQQFLIRVGRAGGAPGIGTLNVVCASPPCPPTFNLSNPGSYRHRLFYIVGTSSGQPWSWSIGWGGNTVHDLNVPGVTPGASASTLAAAFVASINAHVCDDNRLAAFQGSGAYQHFFRVIIGGSQSFSLCVGPAGQTPTCCITSSNICPFNPDIGEIRLSGEDCNLNGEDDTIDLLMGTSHDVNANDVPDECETPPNDRCETPLQILGEGVFEFDNSLADTDGPPSPLCASGDSDQIARDLWYIWTADQTDSVTLTTCGQTMVDTKIAVLIEELGLACPPAIVIACDDDGCQSPQSRVQWNAAAGARYLLRIGSSPGSSGGPGTFTIELGTPCPADWNDDGVVNTADFFEFFGAFFGDPPDADFNGDGQTNTADFFEFFAAFFGPPCP